MADRRNPVLRSPARRKKRRGWRKALMLNLLQLSGLGVTAIGFFIGVVLGRTADGFLVGGILGLALARRIVTT